MAMAGGRNDFPPRSLLLISAQSLSTRILERKGSQPVSPLLAVIIHLRGEADVCTTWARVLLSLKTSRKRNKIPFPSHSIY
jgi:hypothetical protein